MRIALVYPELLGTYGDGGNAEVLLARARWRGLDAELINVPAGEAVPAGCDIYVLGGGEDEPQTLAVQGLRQGDALGSALREGAIVLAVCAGFQLLGKSFPGIEGRPTNGLGLIGVETVRVPGAPRAVGDLAVDVSGLPGLGVLTGYENHAGRTRALPGTSGRPLGVVRPGIGMAVGNSTVDGTEGWVQEVGAGLVVATYLHGPVLPQNPRLADLLLSRAYGVALDPLEPDPARELVSARRAELGV